MGFSSLRNRSGERVLAEIVCRNCLEARNSFALHHSFLIADDGSLAVAYLSTVIVTFFALPLFA